jgi:hypothetical protein
MHLELIWRKQLLTSELSDDSFSDRLCSTRYHTYETILREALC